MSLVKIITIDPLKPCPLGTAACVVVKVWDRDEDYVGQAMLIEVVPHQFAGDEPKPLRLHLFTGSNDDPWPSADLRLQTHLCDLENREKGAAADFLHQVLVEALERLARVTFAEFTDAAVAAAAPFEQQTLRLFMGEISKDEQDDLIDFEDPSEARTVERLLVRAWDWQEVRLNNRNLGNLRETARLAAAT